MLGMLARMVEVAAWAYNVGLLAYVVAGYLRARWAARLERTLAPLYEPALRMVRGWFAPVRLGRGRLDLSPLLLFVLVALLRWMAVYILIGG